MARRDAEALREENVSSRSVGVSEEEIPTQKRRGIHSELKLDLNKCHSKHTNTLHMS
ncbi:hypothetical protein IMPR6_160089 [Imperialibacter sp. EC-SDR9]|nr:hypothetical protein IMPERIA89_10354 [Imperialibacter sp. 89]CAD5264133.1 hypothetical protein IMPERIA75_30061 [Imperialibacter sp. 75]VVT07134.1 hypothetical protein IMPR6_160089 [Imperialibacter sp. EC-SDR9]